ncbi:FkbH like protein [Tepidicaulis marinus]|uniref:FkbH like protein n=1 Tax=Tepidicaulis marinus TaxID=1333998 RepID=A0A081B9Q2_9HYPH|nr:HAD-IIIC family phosphatase [Tepidicaulis marinus]GAK44770.1 FkbH like protein [Tepidicaulis marinus]
MTQTPALTFYTSFTGGTLARLATAAGLPAVSEPLDAIETETQKGPAFFWATAEAVSPAFAAAQRMEDVDPAQVCEDAAAFGRRLCRHAEGRPALLAASLVPALPGRGLGPLELTHEAGLKRLLMQMNLTLADTLAGSSVLLLDAERWLAAAGPQAYQPKHWYVAKIPFSDGVFRAAITDLTATRRAQRGEARKIILTDLDDTLWGGILGEVGWEKLRLGGHDYIGEMHQDIQRALKAWSNTGVQLAILSKNDEQNALEALASHPEMILKESDFAGWRIDWNDKAANLQSLLSELRLGLESAVFIDDNPVERDRIRQTFPQVFVPDLPADKTQWPGLIRNLDLFDRAALSDEDRARSRMYQAERARNQDAVKTAGQMESREDWLRSLEMQVTASPLNGTDMQRAVQLLNKTNQMNLTTRRLSEEELKAWLNEPGREFWTFRVADKFGDTGLTGLLGLEVLAETALITDFVMSCRVIGRQVENVLLAHAYTRARASGAVKLEAKLLETERNTPCLEFFQKDAGFQEEAGRVFTWDMGTPYAVPSTIGFSFQEGEAEKLLTETRL